MPKKENERPTLPPETDFLQTVSCQDCTGLIPAGSVDGEEIENYEELYPFLPQTVSKKNE